MMVSSEHKSDLSNLLKFAILSLLPVTFWYFNYLVYHLLLVVKHSPSDQNPTIACISELTVFVNFLILCWNENRKVVKNWEREGMKVQLIHYH